MNLYVEGPVAGLQSPDLTSSARVPQPASRLSPQHIQAHSHAQSVRVPGALSHGAADDDSGWFDAVFLCTFFEVSK